MRGILNALAFCMVLVLFLPQLGIAGYVLETATGDPSQYGLHIASNFFWHMHRFELMRTTRVTAVGGYFQYFDPEGITIFGVIVALSDGIDYPDSIDLSTPDVLTTTLIDVAGTGDFFGQMDIVLEPRWYVVGFGNGKYGATAHARFGMPAFTIDLSPQVDFFAVQPGNPSGLDPQFTELAASARFLVVPEPTTLLLLGLGGLMVRRKR